jgi:hypothetical protein
MGKRSGREEMVVEGKQGALDNTDQNEPPVCSRDGFIV